MEHSRPALAKSGSDSAIGESCPSSAEGAGRINAGFVFDEKEGTFGTGGKYSTEGKLGTGGFVLGDDCDYDEIDEIDGEFPIVVNVVENSQKER